MTLRVFQKSKKVYLKNILENFGGGVCLKFQFFPYREKKTKAFCNANFKNT